MCITRCIGKKTGFPQYFLFVKFHPQVDTQFLQSDIQF